MLAEPTPSTTVTDPPAREAGLVVRAPEGLTVRGTVLVLPGRGESPASYRRFATRIAADAYEVRVAPRPDVDGYREPADLDDYARHVTELLADRPASPVVVVGSDTGALVASALVQRGDLEADAVVLAGLPRQAGTSQEAWEGELAVRSACPVHRKVLTDDPGVARNALATDVPAELVAAALAPSGTVPHLVLAGSDDPIAAGAEADRFVAALPTVELAVVNGAHHDVLNDLQHRTVAATVVTFLERLRQADPAQPIVHIGYSTWAGR